jgi:hypothetical protein
LKQSIRLLLIFGMLTAIRPAFAQAWTQTSAPTNDWVGVASSADGSKLVALAYRDGIYVSTNSGLTWTETTAPTNNYWETVASSADGTTLVAASVGISTCGIYVSTNSGGAWTKANVPSENWTSVASSADGSRLVAVAASDNHFNPPSSVYTSTNLGISWTLQTNAPNKSWTTVASSSDGNKLMIFTAVNICVSTNSGGNWVQANNPPENWYAYAPSKEITCSTDGAGLAVILNGYDNSSSIYISMNLGSTWTKTSAPTPTNVFWSSIASSADGSKLMASANPGPIYVSSDLGLTWKSNDVSSSWTAVAMSADGNKMVAVTRPGGIWTAQITPSPRLNLAPAPTNLTLAWTVPSMNFVLQQSANLISWLVVTSPPVLNLTNLQNQVTLAPSNSSTFYRLIAYKPPADMALIPAAAGSRSANPGPSAKVPSSPSATTR